MSKKIKRILMFHGSDICNNTLNIFSDLAAESFKNKGIEVGFIDLSAQGETLADEYVREMNKGFDAAIAFNSFGQHETTMTGDNVFEYMNVPFFNWILDHPCEHTADIESDLKNYHIICIDRDHAAYVKRYFPKLAGVHFIPIGGTKPNVEIDYSKEAFKARKFDISFTGSSFSLEELGKIIGGLPEQLCNVSTDMIEYMVENRDRNNEEAFRYALEKNNIKTDDEQFRQYAHITAKTNPFLRTYIRSEVIQYLVSAGVEMHLFGSGWDDVEDCGNIIIHESVSYPESVMCAADSRISLNVMPLFKDGMHDRIPTAMLCGSAVVTDGSRYIDEIFNTDGDRRELILYDICHPELIADHLLRALDNIDGLYDIAQRGRHKAESELSWDARVDELIEVISGADSGDNL